MARPSKNTNSTASTLSASALSASAAVYANHRRPRSPSDDRNALAKPWQIEAYRHVNICGEARYAATLFAAMASRAEIGVSEANALSRKAVWVNTGEEVEALSELVPSVRDRAKLIRDYMIHRVIAGECYLIARERREQDPGYIFPPRGFVSWEDYSAEQVGEVDVLDPDAVAVETNPNTPVWEIVAVTEIRRNGDGSWEVRYDNNNYIKLSKDDPVIRMWWADPNDRREAWSPFRSLLPTLREIEWLTGHIFRQVRSRLMSAGVWFLPNNMTFPPPPPDAVQGGAEAIAAMNEAEQFMVSLAASGSYELDMDEVSFPSVVMADPASLDQVEQNKLIQFWSEIDDKAMILRSDAVRRFSLGMDLPPEQVLGSSGLAVTGAGGSAGCVDDQTEALTRRGWVKGDDLHPGDEVLTLNHETGVSEWQPVRVMNRFEVVDEPMLRMQGVGHDSVTTMNHRWAVIDREGRRKFVTSETLNQAHRIPTAAPHVGFPTEAKYTDAFVELVAWWWTEGCHTGATESRAEEPYTDSLGRHYPNGNGSRSGRFGQATITQSHERNPERVESIRTALDAEYPGGWGGAHQRQTQTGHGAPVTAFRLRREVFDALHAVAPSKVVSLDFVLSLTRAQIELFIQTSCAGDGWHYRDGRLDIWQRDHGVLDAYELALILSGRMVAESEHAGGKVVNAYRKSTVRPFHAAAAPGSRMIVEGTTYTGMVWCPTVENSTWLARRGGTVWFTGNSVNHWGVWANEEQTISAHIEPALDDLVGALTSGFLRPAVPGTDKVIGYDTASLRLRQDRSKEAVELYDRGLLNAEVTLREVGFDPDNDKMSDAEFQRWLLVRLAGGSATPEQVQAALALLNVTLPASPTAESEPAPGQPGWNNPRSLDDHPYEGPPREQHDQSPAPFGALHASCEALALRAMEKYGNRLLNDGKRGKDRDRTTPVHYAHLVTDVPVGASVDFDFSMAPMLLSGRTAAEQEAVVAAVSRYCTRLVEDKIAYDRTGLIAALEGFDD